MSRVIFLALFGLAAIALATESFSQDAEYIYAVESSSHADEHGYAAPTSTSSYMYTGPMFDPSNALIYGPSRTLNSTTASTTSQARPSTMASHASHASNSTIAVKTSTLKSRSSTTILSTTSAPGSTNTMSAPAQVSTDAAQANYVGYMGTLAGGVFAGLALM